MQMIAKKSLSFKCIPPTLDTRKGLKIKQGYTSQQAFQMGGHTMLQFCIVPAENTRHINFQNQNIILLQYNIDTGWENMADLIGQVINQKYKIVELLDEGGMAMVYRADDIHLNRTVALKIILKEKFKKEQLEEILQRFDQEAKALAKLAHPNIVPILDYGEFNGSPYLVLEYLSGGTLRKWMEQPQLLPWQVAINLMLPIMDALTYCHEHGILHRDIKPSNILFREDDTPVLTDFGIAKLSETAGTPPKTLTGVFVGTPGYMAPEQLNNSNPTKLDPRTDVHQVGIVLYEAITGHRPSDLANIFENLPPPKSYVSNLPTVFDDIILTALELDPDDRYQSMEEFKNALLDALKDHPTSSDTQGQLPPKVTPRTPKPPENKSRPLPVYLSSAWSDEENIINLGRALRQDGMRSRPDKKNSKPGSTNPGANWQDKLLIDIKKSEAVIVCLTSNSLTRNDKLKPEIKLAIDMAHAKSLPIIPVRIHECKIPLELLRAEQVDLFEEDGYKKLRSSLSERAASIGAALPLEEGFYIQPQIETGRRLPVPYVVLGSFILLIAILFMYSSLQQTPSIATPTQDVTATSAITATEPLASDIPTRGPGVSSYDSKIVDSKGTEMLLVPSGEFMMGYNIEEAMEECKKYSSHCSLVQIRKAGQTKPISLDAFYIDKSEVSNRDYQKCVDEKVCQPPKETKSSGNPEYYGLPKFDSYPVIYVDWNMAKTYCEKWRGARLPTEAEWEKAARGTDGNIFPWGNTFSGVRGNFCDKNCPVNAANINWVDGYSDIAPVYALINGKSPYDLLNMAGNVWEWVSSLYKDYPYNPDDGRENLQTPGVRVVRGGSWRDDISSLFSFARNGYDPSYANETIGFRCARSSP
jgi:serine/threonine protein kinase/formylglycine-generating enzyme required for sulfatase activity